MTTLPCGCILWGSTSMCPLHAIAAETAAERDRLEAEVARFDADIKTMDELLSSNTALTEERDRLREALERIMGFPYHRAKLIRICSDALAAQDRTKEATDGGSV